MPLAEWCVRAEQRKVRAVCAPPPDRPAVRHKSEEVDWNATRITHHSRTTHIAREHEAQVEAAAQTRQDASRIFFSETSYQKGNEKQSIGNQSLKR